MKKKKVNRFNVFIKLLHYRYFIIIIMQICIDTNLPNDASRDCFGHSGIATLLFAR